MASNRSPKDWYPLFPNTVLAEGILDRLVNKAHHMVLTGRSYRTQLKPEQTEPGCHLWGLYATIVPVSAKREAPLLYIFYGDDDFSSHQALVDLKRDFGDEEVLEVSTSRFDGQQLDPGQLKAACNTVPFLSPSRLVIVEGLLSRFEPRRRGEATDTRRDKTLEAWLSLAEYVPTMPPSTVLVLTDIEVTRRNRLFLQLAPLATVQHFPRLKGKELQRWIQARVTRQGGSITPRAQRLLAELVGGDLWTMAVEIEKLLVYAGGRPVDEADVRQLVSQSKEASIFVMVDALVQGEMAVAARLLHQLLTEGASVSYIITMVARQLRLMLLAAELRSLHLPGEEMRRRLGVTSDFFLQQALSQAGRYPRERIGRSYRQLLEADVSIKTGRLAPEQALDLLVVELCHRVS
ncbi:MAG: DNA polymerase III subunit delta [Chloroflexi bacterium]|nr:DNA polymerase III subunit delta [Chloroflexota bacterium]